MLIDLIVLTKEGFSETESTFLNEILDAGLQTLHLRKPKSPLEQFRNLIKAIHPQHHHKLVIHQHHELTKEFSLKGIHLTSKFRTKSRFWNEQTYVNAAKAKGLSVSTSIHSLVELRLVNEKYDYCFLSPVFDSISKTGYQGKQDDFKDLAAHKHEQTKVYALGGITFENVSTLVESPFDGIAVLGYIWDSDNPKNRFLELKNKLSNLV